VNSASPESVYLDGESRHAFEGDNVPGRLVKIGIAAAALAATAAVGVGIANAQEQTPATADNSAHNVPAALVPPTGNKLAGVFDGQGVQVYQCTNAAYVFVEPAATLNGVLSGKPQTAVHFRGPSWESTKDGSLVEGSAVANVPVTGSIPQLLLKASKNRGDGGFGKVTYIQRLNTSGGAAPTGACTEGATVGVPYHATYRFFVAS
jgi:hypothetical protein